MLIKRERFYKRKFQEKFKNLIKNARKTFKKLEKSLKNLKILILKKIFIKKYF